MTNKQPNLLHAVGPYLTKQTRRMRERAPDGVKLKLGTEACITVGPRGRALQALHDAQPAQAAALSHAFVSASMPMVHD